MNNKCKFCGKDLTNNKFWDNRAKRKYWDYCNLRCYHGGDWEKKPEQEPAVDCLERKRGAKLIPVFLKPELIAK